MTYEILEKGEAIICLVCGMTSWNRNDVRELFCAKCGRWHGQKNKEIDMNDIKYWPGWTGAFTRDEALGAWKNGTPVVKANSEPGDAHPDGTPGVVLGSISHPSVQNGAVFYFIEWAPRPRTAVVAGAIKVQARS